MEKVLGNSTGTPSAVVFLSDRSLIKRFNSFLTHLKTNTRKKREIRNLGHLQHS